MRYRCEYNASDIVSNPRRYVRVDTLADVKDGFWLNPYYEFTKGEDACFWIPPSAIRYVQKERDKDDT